LYASTSLSGDHGYELLRNAVKTLLSTVEVTPTPSILWSLEYGQQSISATDVLSNISDDRVLRFSNTAFDLAFDDVILDNVKDVWQKILGGDAGDFLVFEDREANDDDE
jgi:Rab proteins geranylgeranyltransferase component A